MFQFNIKIVRVHCISFPFSHVQTTGRHESNIKQNNNTTDTKRSLAVGARTGFSLFSLNSIDSSLEEIYASAGEEISIVERLFSSSLVAVVSLNAPRKLKVSHTLCPQHFFVCVCALFMENFDNHKYTTLFLNRSTPLPRFTFINPGLSLQKRH